MRVCVLLGTQPSCIETAARPSRDPECRLYVRGEKFDETGTGTSACIYVIVTLESCGSKRAAGHIPRVHGACWLRMYLDAPGKGGMWGTDAKRHTTLRATRVRISCYHVTPHLLGGATAVRKSRSSRTRVPSRAVSEISRPLRDSPNSQVMRHTAAHCRQKRTGRRRAISAARTVVRQGCWVCSSGWQGIETRTL